MINRLSIKNNIPFRAIHLNQYERIGNETVLNHKTSFFRYSDKENTDAFVVSLLRRKNNDKPLAIVSAGCSFGEEVYSYALACEKYGIKANISGFDISSTVINEAKQGKYYLNEKELDYLVKYQKGKKRTPFQKAMSDTFARNFEQKERHKNCYQLKNDKLTNCEFRLGDVKKIQTLYGKNSQDLILCRYVLYHIPNIEELYNVFGQFEKILKPGGLLCLNDIEAKYYKEALLTLGFIQPYKNYPWIFEKPKTRKDKLNDFINSIENFINKGVNKK